MKFKKDEMTRLSPRVVADYLESHGWHHHQDVEGKGAIWLYRDDKGNEYEIMLPTNREMGDFAIRMSEAIYTLGEIEERSLREVYSTLAEANALPSEIFESEIAVETGLEWNAAEKSKLEPLMEALNQNCIDEALGNLFACLVEIAELLARGTALIGNEEAKKSAVWRSCEKVLLLAGWPVRDNLSATEFWNAARAGQAETWLDKSFTKELGPARPHPEETEVPDREEGEVAPPDPDGRVRHG
jgi:hypothetical protein